MKKPALSKTSKTNLRRASRSGVGAASARLSNHVENGRWLAPSNQYRNDVIGRLRRESRHDGNQLSQYIAASSLLHCFDGFVYLGRALDGHYRGDLRTARHLGYYAELRAAAALLASEGIGVFLNRHIAVAADRTCIDIKGHGTHEFAWLALEHWSGLAKAAPRLDNVIRPEGVKLAEWLDAFGMTTAAQPVAANWLRIWGLDIKRFAEDRAARNESSYRPSGLYAQSSLSAEEIALFATNVWEILEPASATNPWARLDRYLLRVLIEEAFHSTSGQRARPQNTLFQQTVTRALEAMSLEDSAREQLRGFLMRETGAEDPRIMALARGTARIDEPLHHMEVIARSLLLLRVASGCVVDQLREAPIDWDSLKFWWGNAGLRAMCWDSGAEPAEMIDLWADVQSAADTVRNWNLSGTGTARSMWAAVSEELMVLGNMERAGLWALAI